MKKWAKRNGLLSRLFLWCCPCKEWVGKWVMCWHEVSFSRYLRLMIWVHKVGNFCRWVVLVHLSASWSWTGSTFKSRANSKDTVTNWISIRQLTWHIPDRLKSGSKTTFADFFLLVDEMGWQSCVLRQRWWWQTLFYHQFNSKYTEPFYGQDKETEMAWISNLL